MNQNATEPVAAAESLAEVPEHVLRGLPEEVRLFPSAVDKTRIGVWATKPILKGKKFGPFVGDKKKRSQVKNNVYMWEVYYPNLGWMCIDATDPEKGNWLRYVNWACSGEEQNLFPLEINRAIYYKTLKPIAPGEELLVWYNGEDNPEIAAAIEEERASARSKRSSPKSRKATVSAWRPGVLLQPPRTSPGSVGMSRRRLQPSSRDPSSKSRHFACSLTGTGAASGTAWAALGPGRAGAWVFGLGWEAGKRVGLVCAGWRLRGLPAGRCGPWTPPPALPLTGGGTSARYSASLSLSFHIYKVGVTYFIGCENYKGHMYAKHVDQCLTHRKHQVSISSCY
uniref:PR/SET domain 2 n=1 Tax=Lynx canadensis TaxID=61383 RepID=A0A667J6F2_LYNCA